MDEIEQQDGLSNHKKSELKQQQNQEQKELEREAFAKEKRKKSLKRYGIIAIVVILILATVTLLTVRATKAPGPYDDFAKCLSDKGALMYGAIEWCKYTQEQATMFGKSFKYVNYVDYKARGDIKITPTWLIDGQLYERVQSFEKLSELTGCDY